MLSIRKDRLHFRKLAYYTRNVAMRVVPRPLLCARLPKLLEALGDYPRDQILERVEYYNKITEPFAVDSAAPPCRLRDVQSAYYFDFQRHLRYFPASVRYYFRFSDSTKILERPTFFKARPCDGANENSVILKLDALRHFRFVRDAVRFEDKMDIAVFSGACKRNHRRLFLEKTAGFPRTDIGDTRKDIPDSPFRKPHLTIAEQLRSKFVISVEGNDVATNLMWIMSSNSLCFMRRPTCETWFMEGRLEPGLHYVQLRDDYSDLPEKIDFYSRNTDRALEIIRAAHAHIDQFRDPRKERLVFLMVMAKYFVLSGQLDPRSAGLPAEIFRGRGR